MKYIVYLSWLFFGLNYSFAQEGTTSKNPYPVAYKSDVDQLLNIKTLLVVPAYDNVNGIYKKSADQKIKELISEDSFWTVVGLKNEASYTLTSSNLLDEKPEYARRLISENSADALLSPLITKSSSGLSVSLSLYTKDGQILIYVNQQDEKAFEISKLNEMLSSLYQQVKQKLPYHGYVASRNGNTVTVNVGQKSGVKNNDKLTVAQVLSLRRHPKLKFMTGVEKEIIGQLVVTKADSELSFAQIVFEKEKGVIQKGSKLLPLGFVDYQDGQQLQPILENEKNAQEWVPAAPPQYGKIGLSVGISDYSLSLVDRATGQGYGSSQGIVPTFKLSTELWLTAEWFASLEIQQQLFEMKNGLATSSPGSLTVNRNTIDILLGYKYLITGHFWGPQINVALGLLSKNKSVTDTNPTTYTSTREKSWQLQVGGVLPVSEDYKSAVGGYIKLPFFTKISERPVDSGDGDLTLSQLGMFFTYQMSTHLQLKPELIYSSSAVSYSGTGTRADQIRSSDEKNTSLLFGIEYLF